MAVWLEMAWMLLMEELRLMVLVLMALVEEQVVQIVWNPFLRIEVVVQEVED